VTTAAGGILNHGHDDWLVQRVAIDGVDVIRKRYRRADALEVFGAMTDLWQSPFGASRVSPGLPQPLRLHSDRSGMDMACVDGRMLGERGDVGFLPQRLSDVAALLADLHSSGVVVPRRRTAAKLVASLQRKFADQPHAVVDHLAVLAPHLHETVAVSHGDFSPRNVVVGAHGLVLIDFDRVQMAGAGRDVQHLAAWAWVTEVTAGRVDPTGGWALGDRFEMAYAERRPALHDELRHTRAFHRASSLVRIATSWSALQVDRATRGFVLDEAMRVLQRP
jgi:aminoglycoside phosphotransferase (APT) family kinase protein